MQNSQSTQSSSFFELLHAIDKQQADPSLMRIGEKQLQLRSHRTLAFPTRDVFSYSERDDKLVISCNFMGLYGVDSPLPAYFNEFCFHESDWSEGFCQFLDLFNHRIYVLYFLAWKAFRPDYALASGQGEYRQLIDATATKAAYQEQTETYGVGIRGNRSELYMVLHRLLPGIPIRIEENKPQWLQAEAGTYLDGSSSLGENTLMGEALYHASTSVRVQLGPVPASVGLVLFSEGDCIRTLQSMWEAIRPSPMTCQWELLLTVEKPCLTLGDSLANIGRHAWLGDWAGGETAIKWASS